MKKVLIVCPYPHGRAPSQRFRFEQYLDLVEADFDIHSFWKADEWPRIYEDGSIKYKVLRTIGGFCRRLLLLGQVRKFDKVFVHREATPIGPPWFEWAVVKLFKKPLIYDFDDAIWLPNSSKANEKLAGKLKFHGKTAKICAWATTCSVGNSFLADYAREYCDDVRIIPTTIDTDHHHNPALYEKVGSKWVRKNQQQTTESSKSEELPEADSRQQEAHFTETAQTKQNSPKQEDQPTTNKKQSMESSNAANQPEADSLQPAANRTNHVTIGWTGTHSTLKQLIPLFPLLRKIHKIHPFRFLLIADIPPDTMPSFVEFRRWKKETEIEDLMEIDIGVMPLYDTDWERGKCGFKALQYQALCIPAVVSSVGVNTAIVLDGSTGFTCESFPLGEAKKWKFALMELLQNNEARLEMGLSARRHVEDHYSVSSQKVAYQKPLMQ